MISEEAGINNVFLSKAEQYAYCISAISGISEGEENLVGNLANAAAILKETFGWWWVGFYTVKNDELILGPFQGPSACTRIGFGKGVCGTAWKLKESVLVPDVHRFAGHIACSAVSNSELVVPVLKNNEVVAVLDADSEHFAHFDALDQQGLEQIATLAATWF